jgi:hypothetical protein
MTSLSMRHRLPSYFPLRKYLFDLELIKKEVSGMEKYFTNVLKSNKELCSNNHALVESVIDHYRQISLTSCPLSNDKFDYLDCKLLGETGGQFGTQAPLSKHALYRLKSSRRKDRPELDEHNYFEPTPLYANTYMRTCVESLGERPLRVRLVKLKAGKSVDWHIDYDPTYATRIILTVTTNDKVINSTKRRGKIENIHIPANGIPYFLNTGFSHMVSNNGDSDRIVLMFSLSSKKILDEISLEWNSQGRPSPASAFAAM